LARFFRSQVLYIAISAIGGATFWAIGQRINPLTVLLHGLAIGNLTVLITLRLHGLYAERAFPYNWLLFLVFLLVLLIPIYVISSAFVWLLAPPTPQTLGHLLRTGWKFPILITFVSSALVFLYRTTKEKLEQRNIELQRTVGLRATQLEIQEQELQRAREIQQSLLPKEIPQLPGFEVSAAWRPARMVSGDYYDVFRLGANQLGVCIADVVGKGVSSALLMANVQAAVRAYASSSDSSAGLCEKVNKLLCENVAIGKFVTFFYGVLDVKTRTFQYCNAGHPNPIRVSHGQCQMLDAGGAVLGVLPASEHTHSMIPLEPQDRLMLFTDGITEAEGANAQEFGMESVAAYAQSNNRKSAQELSNGLLARVSAFCEGHFQDDATVVVAAAC
jgi:sigma-B regulation protein RsbU (phosphoserine phosphatase)